MWGGGARAEELLPEGQNPAPSSAQTEAEPFVAFRYAVVAVRNSVGLRGCNFFTVRDSQGYGSYTEGGMYEEEVRGVRVK